MKKILVVCTGNICRSPMAEAFLQQEIDHRGLNADISVASAGTYAMVGYPASEGSVVAMAQRGLDISGHRARQLTANMVAEADLILVMEERHRRYIFVTWSHAMLKTLLLSEPAGDHAGVDDPYGGEQWQYDETAEIIENYVRKGMPDILKRLGLADAQ